MNVQIIKWPTPTSAEGSKISISPYSQPGLGNHPDIIGKIERPKRKQSSKGDKTQTIKQPDILNGARLNADFVEYLMGLPAGWTSLEPMDPNAWEEWLTDITAGAFWDTERGIPRVAQPHEQRNARLKALGNGIVPLCLLKVIHN